ncbi:uncharacterized protein B0H18DRAFT_887798, partial [Fomitopsis serialis]|uniref:uncharacterized protein n=1 Tax=Fomitopsis serialis TaxID=139415 RepID=UPI002008E584
MRSRRAPFVPLSDPDERTCPACDREFDTSQGLMAHLSTAKSCLWYRKGKNKDLWSNLPNVEERMVEEQALSSAEDMEVDPQENIWDALENRDLFRFVLPDAGTQPATQDENQASSSTHPAVLPDPRVVQAPALDDDEDDRVEEEDSLAGKVIRMDATIVQTWKAFFTDDLEDDTSDTDQMEVDSEDGRPRGRDRSEVWKPFASELDWRVAMWVVREDVGQKSINRFLSIPGVVEKLGLTFKDVRELLLKVDDIPDRAAWKTASLSFPDRPDEIHLVRYRDILQAIKALLGNPTYAKHIVYRPRQVFSDRSKQKRVYTEMWTGLW